MSPTSSISFKQLIRLENLTVYPGEKLQGSIIAQPVFDIQNVTLSMNIVGKLTTRIVDVRTENSEKILLNLFIPIQKNKILTEDFEYKFSIVLPSKLLPSMNFEGQFQLAKISYNIQLTTEIEDFNQNQIFKEFFIAPIMPVPFPEPAFVDKEEPLVTCFCGHPEAKLERTITASLSHGFAYPGDLIKLKYKIVGYNNSSLQAVLVEHVIIKTESLIQKIQNNIFSRTLLVQKGDHQQEMEIQVPYQIQLSSVKDSRFECWYSVEIQSVAASLSQGNPIVSLPIHIVQNIDQQSTQNY